MGSIRYISLILLSILFSCNADVDSSELREHSDEVYEDLTLYDSSKDTIEYLIVHCTCTDPKRPWSSERLKKFFKDPKPKGNGWDRYGYHDYITFDGKVHNLTPYNSDNKISSRELTYNARGYNSKSLAVALEGGCERLGNRMISKDNFSKEQRQSLRSYISKIVKQRVGIKVIPHNRVTRKDCPVINLESIWKG